MNADIKKLAKRKKKNWTCFVDILYYCISFLSIIICFILFGGYAYFRAGECDVLERELIWSETVAGSLLFSFTLF